MKTDDRITVFLSPGELFWIAGYLGIATLPLLSGHYRGQSSEKMMEDIQHGYEALELRDLVRSTGTRKWEVDNTLVNLVQMIGSPEYALLVNSSHRDQPGEQVFLYFKNQQSLSVIYKNRFFNLTLYQRQTVLMKNFSGWIGINSQNSEKAVATRLPKGDYKGLLLKVWSGAEKTVEVLSGIDLSLEETQKLANVFTQATTAGMVNRLTWQDGRLVKQGQVIFLSNSINLWCSEIIGEATDIQTLQPINASKAGDIIRKYLGSEFEEGTAPEAE